MKKWGGSLSEKDPKGDGDDQIPFWRHTWGGVKRAVLGSFAAACFALVILMASVIAATNPGSVFPHGTEGTVKAEKVEYYLPYPGVLPDSPLYRLKAVRDRVWLWVTPGDEKKAHMELLFADKRINAAMFLVDGGKEALGVTTATKAEKYLEAAVNRAIKLFGEGKDVKSLLGTLQSATAKHIELLEGLQATATGERKAAVEQAAMQTGGLHERVEQALLEAK